MTHDLSFEECFDRLLGHERELSMNPKDKGNWTGGKVGVGTLKGTKYGVSAARYPYLDIANLTVEQARDIAWKDYWIPARCNIVPAHLRHGMLNVAYMSGPVLAIKMAQRACGAHPDGLLGPRTLQCLANFTNEPFRLVARFWGHYLDWLNDRANWDDFSEGWSQRVALELQRL